MKDTVKQDKKGKFSEELAASQLDCALVWEHGHLSPVSTQHGGSQSLRARCLDLFEDAKE